MLDQLPSVPPPAPSPRAQSGPGKAPLPPPGAGSDTIFGKPFVEPAVPIQDVTLDMRTVCVAGRIFAADHGELTKNNAIVVNFDITDYTGSIRINRYFREGICPRPRQLWRLLPSAIG